MTYGHIYVASVAMGAKDEHTLRALLEAESYDGPSLVIAYSHCIAHGIDMIDAPCRTRNSGRLRAVVALPVRPATRDGGAESAAIGLVQADPSQSKDIC